MMIADYITKLEDAENEADALRQQVAELETVLIWARQIYRVWREDSTVDEIDGLVADAPAIVASPASEGGGSEP